MELTGLSFEEQARVRLKSPTEQLKACDECKHTGMRVQAGVGFTTIANQVGADKRPIPQRLPRINTTYCSCPRGRAMAEVANAQV